MYLGVIMSFVRRFTRFFGFLFLIFSNIYPMQEQPSSSNGSIACSTVAPIAQSHEDQSIENIENIFNNLSQNEAQFAANWFALHELLFENNYSEHLSTKDDFNNFEWDNNITDILDALGLLFQKAPESLQSLFLEFDNHLAHHGSGFNFANFKIFILSRKELGIAFWEFVNKFNTFAKVVQELNKLTHTPNIQSLSKNTQQTIIITIINEIAKQTDLYKKTITELTHRFGKDAIYLSPSLFDMFYKLSAKMYGMQYFAQCAELEKATDLLESGSLLSKIMHKMIAALHDFDKEFKKLEDLSSIRKPQDAFGQKITSLYENAHYFKKTYARIYTLLISKIDEPNQKFLFGQHIHKKLPTTLFLSWNILASDDLQTNQELLNTFERIIKLRQKFERYSTFSKIPDPKNPDHFLGMRTIDNADAIRAAFEEYRQKTDAIKSEYPELFERWGSFDYFEKLNAMTTPITLPDKYIITYPMPRIKATIEQYQKLADERVSFLRAIQNKEKKTLREKERKLSKSKTKAHHKTLKKQQPETVMNQTLEAPAEDELDNITDCSTQIDTITTNNNTADDSFDSIKLMTLLFFSFDRVAEDSTQHCIIRQLNNKTFWNGCTLVVYKNEPKQIPSLRFDQLTKRNNCDTFHSFSQLVNNLLPYGKVVSNQTDMTSYHFAYPIKLTASQKAIILHGKIINDKYYHGDPETDCSKVERGIHNGAFVFIYDENTCQCFHRCFHETIESHTANHQ
jgi:hypothetical protein